MLINLNYNHLVSPCFLGIDSVAHAYLEEYCRSIPVLRFLWEMFTIVLIRVMFYFLVARQPYSRRAVRISEPHRNDNPERYQRWSGESRDIFSGRLSSVNGAGSLECAPASASLHLCICHSCLNLSACSTRPTGIITACMPAYRHPCISALSCTLSCFSTLLYYHRLWPM